MTNIMADKKWRLLLKILWTFLKMGPITFGGGYAMIPLIEKEIVTKHKWVKREEMTDVFALSSSIPGAVAINSAMFVGYRIAGIAGAIAAMIGVLLPTFLIVIALSALFSYIQHDPKLEAAFIGIKAATAAMILFAGIRIGQTAVLDKTTLFFAIATVLVLMTIPVHPIALILVGGVVGIILVPIKQKLGYSAFSHQRDDVLHTNSPDYFMGEGI